MASTLQQFLPNQQYNPYGSSSYGMVQGPGIFPNPGQAATTGGTGTTTLNNVQNTGGVQTTGGTTGQSSMFPPSYYLHDTPFEGKNYDLSDPTQAQAYYNAQVASLQGTRDVTNTQNTAALQNSLTNTGNTDITALHGLNQGAVNTGEGILQNVLDAGNNYTLGNINNQQKFAQLSPNAFQSGQATQFNNDTSNYNNNLQALKTSAQQQLGGNYFQNGQIDPNSTFGSQIGGLESGYNSYLTQQTLDNNNNQRAAENAYGSGSNSAQQNLENLYAYAGLTPPPLNGVSYDPNAMYSTDLSQYTPYTSASQLAGAQGAQASRFTGSTNPYASYLGYEPNATQNNFLNAFMNPSGGQSGSTGQ